MWFNAQIWSCCCCCILDQEISFALLQSGANLLKQPMWSCVSLGKTLGSHCSSPPNCLMGTCFLLGKVAGLSYWPLDPQENLQTLFVDPDHLCFGRTTYDNINSPGGPLMYLDQISRYSLSFPKPPARFRLLNFEAKFQNFLSNFNS